jgi:hypothetical protein
MGRSLPTQGILGHTRCASPPAAEARTVEVTHPDPLLHTGWHAAHCHLKGLDHVGVVVLEILLVTTGKPTAGRGLRASDNSTELPTVRPD